MPVNGDEYEGQTVLILGGGKFYLDMVTDLVILFTVPKNDGSRTFKHNA